MSASHMELFQTIHSVPSQLHTIAVEHSTQIELSKAQKNLHLACDKKLTCLPKALHSPSVPSF